MADTARTSVPRTDATAAPASPAHPLARLYLVRALAALLWAALLVLAAPTAGPQQIALLVLYPLLDAAAVAWQVRADRRAASTSWSASSSPSRSEWRRPSPRRRRSSCGGCGRSERACRS